MKKKIGAGEIPRTFAAIRFRNFRFRVCCQKKQNYSLQVSLYFHGLVSQKLREEQTPPVALRPNAGHGLLIPEVS